MAARRHPIHAVPFDDEIANALEAEYREQSFGRRFQARRKAFGRDLWLLLSGQARRQCDRVPRTTRRLLWVYTWTTVGDAIMDLAPRRLVPDSIDVDLLISPALAPLFASDRRLRTVYSDAADCADDYDFVLLDSLRSRSLRLKRKRYAGLPFATMRGHQAGERFDRAAFADRRLRQLFGLPIGPVQAPRLDLDDAERPAGRLTDRFRIGLALGARVTRKLYPHWAEVVSELTVKWPSAVAPPEFVTLGQGSSARRQQKAVEAALAALGTPPVKQVDSGSLGKTAHDLASCDAFLGVDGGLMHVAVAVGTPGLALFTAIDPAYFLRPDSTMEPLASDGGLDAIAPSAVAAAFFAALPRFSAPR